MRRPSARIGRREAVLLAVAPVIAFLVSGASRAGPPWQTANAHAVSRVRRQGGAVAGAAELVDAARFPAELTVPLDMMVPGAMPLVLARIPPASWTSARSPPSVAVNPTKRPCSAAICR